MRPLLVAPVLLLAAGCPPRSAPSTPRSPDDRAAEPDTEAEGPSTPPGMLACTTREVSSDIPGWPNSMVLADLNRDGVLDAAVEYGDAEDASRLSLQLGDGDGRLREVQNLRLGELSYALAAADLDGDGALELFTNDYNRRRLLLFTAAGGGKVRGPMHIRSRFQPGGINPHDTDGDGDLDLVVSSLSHVQIFENRGGLKFKGAGAIAVKQAPDEVVAVDLNRDGKRELMVVANDTSKLYTLGLRAGNRPEVAAVTSTCKKPSVTQAADFDGDGAADLAFHCDDEFAVRLSSGGEITMTASPDIEKMGLGDLDADGDVDVITTGRPCDTCGSQIRLFENDGRGRFRERSIMEIDGTANSPTVADVNGDRAPDLVMTVWPGAPPGRIAVYLGGACGKL